MDSERWTAASGSSEDSLGIRAWTSEDIPKVQEFWSSCGERVLVGDTRDALRRTLSRNPRTLLLAETPEGRILGTVIGTDDGRRGSIYRLIVHPQWRHQNLERTLMARVEHLLKAQGCNKVNLLVAPQISSEDNRLFLALSYRRSPWVEWEKEL